MPAGLIAEVFENRSDEIAARLAALLKSSNGHHYREPSLAAVTARARGLVEAFVASVARTPGRLAAHLEDIAASRVDGGFYLGEFPGALNLLEETAWRLVVDEVPPEHQIEALSRVTSAVGAAKDRLARVYLERALRAETEAGQLRRRLDDPPRGRDSRTVEDHDRE
jgi:hypothetical protein